MNLSEAKQLGDRLTTLHLTHVESSFKTAKAESWGQCTLCSCYGSTNHKMKAIEVETTTRYGAWTRARSLCHQCADEIRQSGKLELPESSKVPEPWGEHLKSAFSLLKLTGGGSVREIRKKAIALGCEPEFNLSQALRTLATSEKWGGAVVRGMSERTIVYSLAAEELENAS